MSIRTKLYQLLFISSFLFLISTESALAVGSITVNRGDQGIRQILYWNIVGGSQSCEGTAPTYPRDADGIADGWNTTHPTTGGLGDTTSIAGWGTKFYAPGGTYRFTCTDAPNFDYVDVIIQDCPIFNPGTVWNNTTHTCTAPAPSIASLSNNGPVSYNSPATLSWAGVANASTCTITGGQYSATPVGNAVNGSLTTNNLTTDTSYTLTCTGTGDPASQTTTVSVQPMPVPAISSFTGPTTVDYSRTATLSYVVANADSCTINGTAVTGGTYTSAALSTDTLYTLACTNVGGTSTSTQTVLVASGAFTAPANNSTCTIPSQGSACTNVSLAWSMVNAPAPIIKNSTTGFLVSNAPSSPGTSAQVAFPGATFQLSNRADGTNEVVHSSVTVGADCIPGEVWFGGLGRCDVATCSNGTIDAPTCEQCPNGDYWDTGTSSCKQCSNGGCNGTGGNKNTPIPPTLICNNGSTGGRPLCPTPVSGSCNLTHYACGSGTSISNQSLVNTWSWICSGSNGGSDSPACTESKQCAVDLYWDTLSSTCKTCGNGGCTGPGGNPSTPIPPTLLCANGSGQRPLCTPKPIPSLTASTPDTSHVAPGSTSGTVSSNEKVTLTWGNVSDATSCTLTDNGNVSTAGGTKNVFAILWPVLGKTYTLSCTGPGGGPVTSSVTLNIPPQPTQQTLACNYQTNGDSSITFGWNQPTGGWTHFKTRATTGGNDIPDPVIHDDDFSGGFSKTFSITPVGSQTYTLDVATLATNGAIGASLQRPLTCQRPAPVVTLTPTTANGGSTGSAYFNENGASLSWTANYGATSCTLFKDGASLATYTYPTINSYTLPAIQADALYYIKCSNGRDGTSGNVNISIPPIPTNPLAVCSYSGTNATTSWTLPNGYTGNINMLFDMTAGSTGNCTGSDICNMAGIGSYAKFTTILNHDYTWLARTRDVNNGNYSNVIGGAMSCKMADLVAGNVIAPIKATEGMPTDFGAFMNNNGQSSTGVAFNSFFQVANGVDGSGTIQDLPAINHAALASSESVELRSSFTFPSTGPWSVRLCVDKNNRSDGGLVAESDEGNNCSPSWYNFSVESLPSLSITPSIDQDMRPGIAIDFTSQATDPDNNIIEHNFDYWAPQPDGSRGGTHYSNGSAVGVTPDAEIINITPPANSGVLNPLSGDNTFTKRFKPLLPGIYTLQAAVKETISTVWTTKTIYLNVSCLADEWWNGITKNCVKPTATLTSQCVNGALNAPECTICPTTSIFYDGRCIAGTQCYVDGTQLLPARCGDGQLGKGEECDGALGLSNANYQVCTSKCTITCKAGAPTKFGSPSCGAGTGNVFNAQGEKVKACTNGAPQSSAPTCMSCPIGTISTPTTGGKFVCKAPTCGDKVQNGGEECDGRQGVPQDGSKFCTANCCLVNTPPPLVNTGDIIPKYTLTCTNADKYKITSSAGAIVKQGDYNAPIAYAPLLGDTYTYTCFSSVNTNSKADTQKIANVPPLTTDLTSLAKVFLTATPKSISPNTNVSLSWIIDQPDNSCRIVSAPVITKPTTACDEECIAERYRESDRINGELTYGKTDANDGSRDILTALRTANTNGKSSGRKTVSLRYSTVFYGSCSPNAVADPNSIKVKISVTGDQEG